MNSTSTNITDEKLIHLLDESLIEASQKAELIQLVPVLDDGEKNDVLQLIEDSKLIEAPSSDFTIEQVQDINEQYNAKFNQLVKDSVRSAYKDYESESSDLDQKEISEMEFEINSIPSSSSDSH